jgi:uncharacterized delta-60 repeat protein
VFNRVLAMGDGRIVAVGATGTANGWGAMRFNSDGALDATFGNGGIAIPAPSWPSNMLGQNAIDGALQSDGKIVMVDIEFDVLRLNANGTLDTSFGSHGIAQFLQHNGAHAIYGSSNIAVGPDGKITIVGATSGSGVIIARLNPNGSVDATLGTKQTPGYITDPGNYLPERKCLVIGSDGRITTVGISGSSCMVARYLSSGARDSSFGSGGKVLFTVSGGSDVASGLSVTGDGHLVVAGNLANNAGLFAARFTVAGVFDASFGNGGGVALLMSAPVAGCEGVAVQADGGVLVASGFPEAGGTGSVDMGVWRLTAAGVPDTGFGPTGDGVSQLIGQPGTEDAPRSVTIDASGRVILAGLGWFNGSPAPEMVVIRGQ